MYSDSSTYFYITQSLEKWEGINLKFYGTCITNDIRYTSQTQQNLLLSKKSSEWQHVSAFHSNDAIISLCLTCIRYIIFILVITHNGDKPTKDFTVHTHM